MRRQWLLRLGMAALVGGSALSVSAVPAGFHPHQERSYAAKLKGAAKSTTSSSSSSSSTPSSSSRTSSTEPPTTTTVAPSTTTQAPTTTAPRPTNTAPPGTKAPAPTEALPRPTTAPPVRDLTPYRGLGTWIDAFDFSPQFQPQGKPPTVTVENFNEMAAAGIKTVYLQAAKDDPRSPGLLVNPEIIGPMLQRAHSLGMKLVAWYLPKFYDLDSDMRRLQALRDFRFEGDGFDGLGLDIEWRKDVPDTAERNRRLVELSRRLRAAMGSATLASIPLPPIVMEVVNTDYWPDFPWRDIAEYYDVWLPMTYWTFRTQRSGYRDAYRYTEENIRRMRSNLGLPDAPVHPAGGTDGKSTDDDYRGFVRACAEQRCVGGSIYDWRTTPPRAWGILRALPN